MFSRLRDDFVCGWTNIRRESYVGYSLGYSPRQGAVGTTNGAGAHNVQILMLAGDGVVVHALPGFWHPEDLARELDFARVVHRLWTDAGKTQAQKRRIFDRLHEIELRKLSDASIARSDWQLFDRQAELLRIADEPERDTVIRCGDDEAVELVPLHRLILTSLLLVVDGRVLARQAV